MSRSPFYGLMLACFGALALTPDTLFMRWSGMGGFAMLGWRGLLTGLVLLAVWAVASRDRAGELRALAGGAALAVICFHFLNASFFSLAVAAAPVAVVLMAVATVPVFAAVFSWVLMGERTGLATWLTIAVVLAGIALAVTGPDAGHVGLNLRSLLGAVLGLGVAVTLALTFVVLRRSASVPILPAIGLGALLAGCLGTALAGPSAMAGGRIWAIAVSGALILPVSFFALSLASRHTHASNVSLLLLLETILGPAWVWLGTGEAPTPRMMTGGAVVVAALAAYLVHSERRMRPAEKRPRREAPGPGTGGSGL